MADGADAIKAQGVGRGCQACGAGLSGRQGVVAVKQAQMWVQLVAQCIGGAVAEVLRPGLQCGLRSLLTLFHAEAEHQALRECGTSFDRLWLKLEWLMLFCSSDQVFDRQIEAFEMVAVKGDVRRQPAAIQLLLCAVRNLLQCRCCLLIGHQPVRHDLFDIQVVCVFLPSQS